MRGKGGGEVEGGVREEWNTGRSEREGRGSSGGRGGEEDGVKRRGKRRNGGGVGVRM